MGESPSEKNSGKEVKVNKSDTQGGGVWFLGRQPWVLERAKYQELLESSLPGMHIASGHLGPGHLGNSTDAPDLLPVTAVFLITLGDSGSSEQLLQGPRRPLPGWRGTTGPICPHSPTLARTHPCWTQATLHFTAPMGPLVPSEEAQVAEALPTVLTFVDPLGQVQPLMDAEAPGPPEGFPTLRAGIGLLTTVDPLVVVEVLLSAEVLAADGTVERPLTRVYQLVA